MIDLICGFLIGSLSLIPGISSDMALIALNKYEDYILILGNLKKCKKEEWFIILRIIIGSIIGIFATANILEWLFLYYPKITLYTLVFLLLCTLPNFYKKEIKKIKFSNTYFFIGIITILLMFIFLNKSIPPVVIEYPKLTIWFLLSFSLYGALDGILTITPGVSGSMVMMMLNVYYLYKSYAANIFFTPIFILPLAIYLIGDLIGILIGSKINAYFIIRHRDKFMSLIWGFILMSLIIIFL